MKYEVYMLLFSLIGYISIFVMGMRLLFVCVDIESKILLIIMNVLVVIMIVLSAFGLYDIDKHDLDFIDEEPEDESV